MTDLYKEAARIVRRANLKEGSLKTLVYSSSYRNLRQLFALVSESVKYQSILKDILARCSSSLLNEEIIDCDHELALVLLYELLVGNGFGRAGFIRKVMRQYKGEIKAAQDAFLKEKNAVCLADILKGISSEKNAIPRYARVNLIKCSVDESIEKLCEEGWEHIGKISIDKFQEEVKSLGETQFGLDPLLNDLLVFPINTDLHDHALVTDGILVLQDKASCVPAHALNPDVGSVVLDCCAAPGNKTSHLASLMGDKGRIIALDRDAKRMSTMESLLQRSGASSVETVVQDFLTLSPQSDEVSDIRMILVDPSCSGSGMHGSRLSSSDGAVNPQRLQSLKRFQISLLKHALRFPEVQRVVYSTCSIHQQENEEVVEEVMGNVNRYFQFVPVLPQWPDSRGLKQFQNHLNFLRLSPEKHSTAGFFVACFERKKSSKPKQEDANDEDCNVDEGVQSPQSQNCDSELSVQNVRHVHKADDKDTGGGKRSKQIEIDLEDDVGDASLFDEIVENSSRKKKKKEKRKTSDGDSDIVIGEGIENSQGKKKKSRKTIDENISESVENSCDIADTELQNVSDKKKKKKRKKEKGDNDSLECLEDSCTISENERNSSNRKRKWKGTDQNISESLDNSSSTISENEQNLSVKKKKKKKRKEKGDNDSLECLEDSCTISENDQNSSNKTRKWKGTDQNISEIIDNSSSTISENEQNLSVKKKKKKKRKEKDENESEEFIGDEKNSFSEDQPSLSKKKKKRKKERDEN